MLPHHTFTSPMLGIDRFLTPGTQASFTFAMPSGVVPFSCAIHQIGGMEGTITPG